MRLRLSRRRPSTSQQVSDELFIRRGPPEKEPRRIVKRPRIGVDYAGHWARRLLRFYIRGNPFISKP